MIFCTRARGHGIKESGCDGVVEKKLGVTSVPLAMRFIRPVEMVGD